MSTKRFQIASVLIFLLIVTFTKVLFAFDVPCVIKVHQGESIQAAVDLAAQTYEDCEIWIAPGVYNEDVTIGYDSQSKSFMIIGAGIDRTIIYGSILSFLNDPNGKDRLKIQHLTLDGQGTKPFGLNIVTNHAEIESVRVTKYTEAGVYVQVGATVRLYRCLLDDNKQGLINNPSGEHISIINCTIAKNSSTGVKIFWNGVSQGYGRIVNNIFYQNKTAISENNLPIGSFIEYNDFYQNQNDVVGPIQGDQSTNINVDPSFSNPAASDYRLNGGSRCVNRGDPLSPRDPDGTRADMGAFPAEMRRLSGGDLVRI